jgi:hypothetical protein
MDLYYRLPYEVQKVIMRYTAHPCTLHLWRSEKFRNLAALAAGWYPDWQLRRDRILRDGLPVRIVGARIDSGFFALYFDIDETYLPRSHAVRDFSLHVTLGYTSDWRPSVAEECEIRLNERWRGRSLTLRISWMGCGGAAFLHEDDPIANDFDVVWLHRRWWYADRDIHISL